MFSVEPLLILATHYTGEPGYFSDTETSTICDDEGVATYWDRQNAQRRSEQDSQAPVTPGTLDGDDVAPTSTINNRDEL